MRAATPLGARVQARSFRPRARRFAACVAVWSALACVATGVCAAGYNLSDGYPNVEVLQSGYFLQGQAGDVLWFESEGNGFFKQFASTPFDRCEWDLLRWEPGADGPLDYLATRDSCNSASYEVEFRPGIVFMPKTWSVGQKWVKSGWSLTTYTEGDVAVCRGTNAWQSRILGLVRLPDGEQALHTQTNEVQTFTPIRGAPSSTTCPAGNATTFTWQENFFVDSMLQVQSPDGTVTGFELGLARSSGGNPAFRAATGSPEWNSVFNTWAPLPASSTPPG